MALSIQSNLASTKAVRLLSSNAERLSVVQERLASGQRINRAADDSAGLAVAESLNVKSRVLQRGILNIGDGVSAVQIADGALESIGTLLVRMGELAEQSSSGTYSSEQRRNLNKEFQQLDLEIRRITATTQFNNIYSLTGSDSSRNYTQIAGTYNASDTSISEDGRYLTFLDTTTSSIKQYDRESGSTTTLVSGVGTLSGLATGGNGTVISFGSSANLTGGNASLSSQIYVYDRTNGTLTQLTNNTIAATNYAVNSVSADGSAVGYSSANVSTTEGNVYVTDLERNQTHAVLSFEVLNDLFYDMTLSPDGDRVAVAFGPGGSGGEIYTKTLGANPGALKQETSFGGFMDSTNFEINNEGKLYVFASNFVLGASTQLLEVFNGTYRQLTNSSVNFTVDSMSLGTDGSTVFFKSAGNITGENSGLNSQLFKYDPLGQGLTQETNYNYATASNAILSRDGSTSYYISSGKINIFDLTPQAQSLNIEVGSGAVGQLALNMGALQNSLRGLGALTLSGKAGSKGALDRVMLNIAKLSDLRSTFGANLSRMDTAQRVLSAQKLETQAARGRIINSDVAEESAQLLRYQILQRANASVLAQANQQPEIAIQLIGFQ